MKELIVLLTASIRPSPDAGPLVRADPRQRLADYQAGLRFWLSFPDTRVGGIVLIENSGHPLEPLRATAARCNPLRRPVEFLRAESNWFPPGVHYGYAELAMMDEAVQASPLLAGATCFAKATGRLRFPGFTKLLNALPDELLFAVDARLNRAWVRSPQAFVTTQIMIFSTRFYCRHLAGAHRKMGPGATHAETLLFRELMAFHGQAGAVLRWPCNCDPAGFAAHSRKNYRAPMRRAVSLLRAACRRLLPGWWV